MTKSERLKIMTVEHNVLLFLNKDNRMIDFERFLLTSSIKQMSKTINTLYKNFYNLYKDYDKCVKVQIYYCETRETFYEADFEDFMKIHNPDFKKRNSV